MAKFFESTITEEDLLKRVGNMDQIAKIREFEMKSGKSKGMKVYEVVNGSGMEFTVLGDKCMDIFEMKYNGVPFHFISKAGLVSSEHYSVDPIRFPKNFQGGMLYTCGLINVGPACEDQGTYLGTHGEISHTPANRVSVSTGWFGDEYLLKLEGEMREASLFGENLVLNRTISTTLGSKTLKIQDILENQGFETQPFMLLYHFNFGYPILDEVLRIILPSLQTRHQKNGENDYLNLSRTFTLPIDGKHEEVFYHQVAEDEEGFSYIALYNEKLELGASIKYNTRNLPNLVQWMSMKSGDYALGIEPANCLPEGKIKELDRGSIKMIQPLEKIKYEIELTIIEGKNELKDIESKINNLF